MQVGQSHPHFPILKLDLPMFEGQNPRWWIRRCEKLLILYQIPEHQEITLASTYLNDVAYSWFQGWNGSQEDSSWSDFVEEFCVRFGDWNLVDVVEEFNKLKQEETVQQYQEKFEELKSLMRTLNFGLSEAYFIPSFISGLNDELRPAVKMQQPQFVKQAAESARLQEMIVAALLKKQKFSFRGSQVVLNRGGYKELVKSSQGWRGTVNQYATVGGRSGTFKQWRQVGQCYKCGDWMLCPGVLRKE